jgi:hypothetical protein
VGVNAWSTANHFKASLINIIETGVMGNRKSLQEAIINVQGILRNTTVNP